MAINEPLTPHVDPFARVRSRANSAGIANSDFTEFDDEPFLKLEIPNGRDVRSVFVSEFDAPKLEATEFESVRFLGRYAAIQDLTTGSIEARIVSSARNLTPIAAIRRLPGVELIGEGYTESGGDDDESESTPGKEPSWRIRVESGEAFVELSGPTELFRLLARGAPRSVTLKIPADENLDHDSAVATLERISYNFLFDLDLRYGISVDLGRKAVTRKLRRRVSEQRPPEYPSNRYPEEPLALYRYGRSSSALPLLEFLAYYQSLEFFFPFFSSEAVIKNLKAELQDPRFNPANDDAIARLIQVARPAARLGASERDQLRATVAASIDSESLKEHIAFDENSTTHFCANKQPIQGVRKIALSGDLDIRHQVADRIYDIRCRVVHAKQDGTDSGVELLLPSSDEAAALGPDIDLVRLIAQKALILRSTRVANLPAVG